MKLVHFYTMRHHQMVNTKIRLIIFFAAKDGEALYSQQKQAHASPTLPSLTSCFLLDLGQAFKLSL